MWLVGEVGSRVEAYHYFYDFYGLGWTPHFNSNIVLVEKNVSPKLNHRVLY